eukprot:CAMPEP_0175519800 /NCGR_PEP_ID=MMETSP0096-20121207/16178_1 /TAXON_ID=311494 /ORGANISM="Alexandrium monilatum, Strain CCMP3105" /LENGTH=538 /DNA_ID=CAMNT_0016822193 /DNA_START=26 /DNA_END=1641 /DNA_ORIENTATION=+
MQPAALQGGGHITCLIAVRLQSGPPELVAATARHVVASPVLDDVLLARRRLLHHVTRRQLHVHVGRRDGRRAAVAGRPLPLAEEAHDRVEAAVAQADAANSAALLVNLRRIERVCQQSAPEGKLSLEIAHGLVPCAGVGPEGRGHRAPTAGPEARDGDPFLAPALVKLHGEPVGPAVLARSVPALRTPKQGHVVLAAHWAFRADLRRAWSEDERLALAAPQPRQLRLHVAEEPPHLGGEGARVLRDGRVHLALALRRDARRVESAEELCTAPGQLLLAPRRPTVLAGHVEAARVGQQGNLPLAAAGADRTSQRVRLPPDEHLVRRPFQAGHLGVEAGVELGHEAGRHHAMLQEAGVHARAAPGLEALGGHLPVTLGLHHLHRLLHCAYPTVLAGGVLAAPVAEQGGGAAAAGEALELARPLARPGHREAAALQYPHAELRGEAAARRLVSAGQAARVWAELLHQGLRHGLLAPGTEAPHAAPWHVPTQLLLDPAAATAPACDMPEAPSALVSVLSAPPQDPHAMHAMGRAVGGAVSDV